MQFPGLSGKIARYDIIVIGHLKWNAFFGESPNSPPRGDPSTCTSTMVRGRQADGREYVLVIDPTLRLSPEDYYFDINRRTGLSYKDVTHCFATHEHFDHQIGFNYFPNAVWLAAEPVRQKLKESPYIDSSRVQTASGEFLPGVAVLPLPGHTMGLSGVAFEDGNVRCVVAGDGVMTRDHFAFETSAFEQDSAQAAQTIRELKLIADIIVPGHDNMILNIHMHPEGDAS